MIHVPLFEHERLHASSQPQEAESHHAGRTYVHEHHFRRLARFDERYAESEGERIFNWSASHATAKQWVGVIQVPGLAVEILPKVEKSPAHDTRTLADARKNLLYMLMRAGEIPVRRRDIADVGEGRLPLSDLLVTLFARQLRDELLAGIDRDYVTRRKNRPVLQGKWLFGEHLRRNAARKDRFFVEYDDFVPDNRLNRVFKAACRLLLDSSPSPTTRETLQKCVALLEDVSDRHISDADLDRVTIDRTNERFAELFHFARLVLRDRSPAPSFGRQPSFSLLFDMNRVWEAFVANVMTGRLSRRFPDYRIRPQAEGAKRHLLTRRADDKDMGLLEPDILFEPRDASADRPRLIIDTKWKLLGSTNNGRAKGIATGDLHQMFAYAHRYDTDTCVLLYPHVSEEVPEEEFRIQGGEGKRVSVRFLNLNRDLRAERREVEEEMFELLQAGADSVGLVAG